MFVCQSRMSIVTLVEPLCMFVFRAFVYVCLSQQNEHCNTGRAFVYVCV